jgi:hypothetical protein
MSMTTTKPVEVIQMTPTHAVYFAGDLSFDEVDRNLAYIDRQIASWNQWREWVVTNGEHE